MRYVLLVLGGLFLPYVRAQRVGLKWGKKDVPQPLQDKHILIVDDDPDIVAAMQTMLDGVGAKTSIARDGDSAIQQVDKEQPDLVILDAMLPKRSGFLVLERLKPTKKQGDKPLVLMITANLGTRHQAWAQTLGVDAYMNKPFGMDRLMDQVEKLICD